MPSGPGALFGADVWIALAISAGVTAGHWRVGPGGMGGAGGASGGVGNMAVRKVSHVVWKSIGCCPWKLIISIIVHFMLAAYRLWHSAVQDLGILPIFSFSLPCFSASILVRSTSFCSFVCLLSTGTTL